VRPKQKLLAILRAHLAEIDERIGGLDQLRNELVGHIKKFERWLAENEPR
jgi:hypothetical protein